jgi:hypothetical protein
MFSPIPIALPMPYTVTHEQEESYTKHNIKMFVVEVWGEDVNYDDFNGFVCAAHNKEEAFSLCTESLMEPESMRIEDAHIKEIGVAYDWITPSLILSSRIHTGKGN